MHKNVRHSSRFQITVVPHWLQASVFMATPDRGGILGSAQRRRLRVLPADRPIGRSLQAFSRHFARTETKMAARFGTSSAEGGQAWRERGISDSGPPWHRLIALAWSVEVWHCVAYRAPFLAIFHASVITPGVPVVEFYLRSDNGHWKYNACLPTLFHKI